jgi:CTP:molybdopterin cytidylyltransferase MocA
VVGVLLAAGAGVRAGGPKALRCNDSGTPWLVDRVTALAAGGCRPVIVVLGAAASQARQLLAGAPPVTVVVAGDWAAGMSASLRAGLAAAGDSRCEAALIALVDTPGMTAAVVARLAASGSASGGGVAPSVLARAGYHGVPGHPVLIGRDHWAGVIAAATGDAGARNYLAGREVTVVECGDVGDGRDLDGPPEPAGRLDG